MRTVDWFETEQVPYQEPAEVRNAVGWAELKLAGWRSDESHSSDISFAGFCARVPFGKDFYFGGRCIMFSVGSVFRGIALVLAIAWTFGLGSQRAVAQLGIDDVVIGLSTPVNTFRVSTDGGSSWTNGPDWQTLDIVTGDPEDIAFMQSVEFDNANGLSHNARGNLLTVNFGNSFTGFQIHNLATDGSTASELGWSIIQAQGGTVTPGTAPPAPVLAIRGGGLSVSPTNQYVAFTTFDAGPSGGREIWVLDYNAGAAIGTGSGATFSGPRHTGNGDGAGNPGSFAAMTGTSQGTAWLADTKLIAFNGFGELITLDVAGIAGGTQVNEGVGTFAPTVMTNWQIANNQVALSSTNFTEVEYNPALDANHIYASSVTGSAAAGFVATVYAYDYNTTTGAIALNSSLVIPAAPNGKGREMREMAFDSQGNLYFSLAGDDPSAGDPDIDNYVMKLANATNIAGWNEANFQVVLTMDVDSPFNGLDVAFSAPAVEGLLGDYNENDILDAADYTVWRDAFDGGGTIPNDPTGGVATQEDYDYWKANFGDTLSPGAGAVAAVPEPMTLVLLSAAMALGAVVGNRKRGVAA